MKNYSLDNMEYNKRIISIISFVIIIILAGTLVYHELEGWSYFDSLYFSTTTIATVGFGDLHPITHDGKLFTIFYILIGVSTGLYAFTVIAQHYFESNAHHFEKAVTGIKKVSETHGKIKKHLKNKVKKERDELINSSRLK